ncbi:MAG TPA: hypothetical protein DD491_06795, partial [Halieaceae bacterium]|nr:hypothetical protein [Halieaceae bacterium]
MTASSPGLLALAAVSDPCVLTPAPAASTASPGLTGAIAPACASGSFSRSAPITATTLAADAIGQRFRRFEARHLFPRQAAPDEPLDSLQVLRLFRANQ